MDPSVSAEREMEMEGSEETSHHGDPARKREILAIALAAFSILSIVSLISDAAGAVGTHLAAGLRAFAGQAAYVAPLFILAVSYVAIRARRQPGWWRRVAGIAILFVTLVAALHLFEHRGLPPADWQWRSQWRMGLLGEGGGLLGATIATGLMVAFGLPGTGVIVGAAVLVALTLTFDISWARLAAAVARKFLGLLGGMFRWLWQTVRLAAADAAHSVRRSWERRQVREMRAGRFDGDDPELAPDSEAAAVVPGESFAPPFSPRRRFGRGRQDALAGGEDAFIGSKGPEMSRADAWNGAGSDGPVASADEAVSDAERPAGDEPALPRGAGSPSAQTGGPTTAGSLPGRDSVAAAMETAAAAGAHSGSAQHNSDGGDGAQKKGPVLRLRDWRSGGSFRMPPASLLERPRPSRRSRTQPEPDRSQKLEETLASFGVEAKVVNVSRGPVITRYELQPAPGIKVAKITSLVDDLSLALATAGLRIEAPVPGKAVVGIEVPNRQVEPVYLRDVLESEAFAREASPLTMALGKDIAGQPVVADLRKILHLLIAGATGSGKSVCINSIIISLLYKARPTEVKFIMVDPKRVELAVYDGIPHLMAPVVTDPRQAAGVLRWAVKEMERRYQLISEAGARNIDGYNSQVARRGDLDAEVLPYLVVIIDELADLMMVAAADVEDSICRLAQMARAAGIYLIIATQRPSVDVITGLIKANVPSRISFAVSSQVDSRTILDMAGAERLLGKGDMLFHPLGSGKPQRVQGAFIGDSEVEDVVNYWKQQGSPDYQYHVLEVDDPSSSGADDEEDELFEEAVRLVREQGYASVSMLQRRFRVGYARAARLIDVMEMRGIVGPYQGSKPREVLGTYRSGSDN